jgi:hypothetical protein
MKTFKYQTLPAWVACALVLTLSLLGLVSPAWSDYRSMSGEMAQFHAFMRKHPSVSSDLQSNPRLVYDRKYLDKHDEVRDFLRRHPAVRDEIAQNPQRVFGRYYIDDRREYSDNRPEHRWDYRYGERRDVPVYRDAPAHRNDRAHREDRDQDHRNNRDNRDHRGDHDHQ